VQPWKLTTANYGQIRIADYQVAVLPFGATEPHNLHLPYGTDSLEAEAIASHVCEAAARQGANVVLLPTVPFGTQTNHRGLPLALNLQPTTLLRVASDLIESCVQSGVRKILLLNSHGGNELKVVLRELHGRIDAQLFLCFWPDVVRDRVTEIFAEPDDHAGEIETSLALAYFPDLVARAEDGSLAADDGRTRTFHFRALREGWVAITRPWDRFTKNTGAGNPYLASAEKGERLMQILVERLAPFLVELSATEIDGRGRMPLFNGE
jgi:creatinine amidohydrolase